MVMGKVPQIEHTGIYRSGISISEREGNDCTIHTSIASSTPIDMRVWAAFGVILPQGTDPGAISFWVCDTIDGTYVQLFNDADAAITRTPVTASVGKAFACPNECFPFPYVKMVAATAARTDAKLTAKV
jgi:hypothetical protein